jgi:beta-lactamase regulating signal transducer with metallopeptidase domain
MISIIIQRAAPGLLAHVAVPAIRSLMLAILTGLALAAFRPKSVSIRLAIWTTVLFGALAMPFLGWFLPAVPLRLPARHTAQARTALAPARRRATISPPEPWMAASPQLLPGSRLRATGDPPQRVGKGHTVPAGRPSSILDLWPVILVCAYFVVAAVLLVRFAVGVILSARLRRASVFIDDPRARSLLGQNARTLGITSLPFLAESHVLAVPATLGLHHPGIMLPSGWRQWEDAKLSAVLAHELSHVKRHDGRTQALSVVHRCVFWFSPLAWWLDRKLAELAEQASDEAALRAGADAASYAEVLLGFFALLGTVGRSVRLQAISMAQSSAAEQRIERILHANVQLTVSLKKSALVLLLACAAPVVCFTAAVRPSTVAARTENFQASQQGSTALPAAAVGQAVPPAPPSPAAPNPRFKATVFPKGTARLAPSAPSPAPQPASAPQPAPAMLAAVPPLPPSPRPPEPPGIAQSDSSSLLNEPESRFFNGDQGPDYAVVSGKSVFMCGPGGERDEVNALRNRIKGDFIWFRRDAKSYVIQDPATVKEAAEFFAPEQQLGKEQAALGQQQALVGATQANLGKRMAAVRIQISNDLLSQLEQVEMRIKELGTETNQRELGRLQGELGRLQGEIGRLQAEAGARDGAIGRQMSELGRKQGELGREQGRLGREQGRRARQANREMQRLLDNAFDRRLAKPAP